MNSILIKNCNIINADNQFIGDIYIENGKISKIDSRLSLNADKIIDAKNKYVIPGGIDPHVHLNLPTNVGNSSDNFLTGSVAALRGGTTTLIDFVTPKKSQSIVEAYKLRVEEAKQAKTNIKLHVSPIEYTSTTEAEMTELVENYGVKSFKIYLAYKNTVGLNDDAIVKVLEIAKKLNVLVTAHCENGDLVEYMRNNFIKQGNTSPLYHKLSRPPEAEADAVNRMILYSKFIGTKIYIVHVSSRKSIDLIQQAQKQGVKIYAETCPHYLLLEDSVYEQDFQKSAKYVLSPPIRKIEDRVNLWYAIKKGIVHTVGTDHCPFNLKGQKDIGINDFTKIPNGAGSVEHRLELLYTYGFLKRIIDMKKFVEITSTNVAKIFGLDSKGIIKEGFDADIVVWNPDFEKTISVKNHYQNCDSNIFEGFKTKGIAEFVIINGKIAF